MVAPKSKKAKKQAKPAQNDVEMDELPELVPLDDEEQLQQALPDLDVEPIEEEEEEMVVITRKKGKKRAKLDVVMEEEDEEEQQQSTQKVQDVPMLNQEEFDQKQEQRLKQRREGKHTTEVDVRRVPIPRHRYSRLKAEWNKIVEPIVTQLKLQVR